MAKKISNKKLPISEFKSWLEGVEDMQGEDWTPSLEQWRKIRGKIDLLDEIDYDDLLDDIIAEIKQTSPQRMVSTPAPRMIPSHYSDPMPNSVPSSSLEVVRPKLTTNFPPPAVGSTKTPDVDTSNGTYETQFV